ncbi:hypothetical protein CMI37_38105 [Candidatus Pacearchaeota archaeon]|nr:hypothetical protein [Candidatus Pacearchaeota archaeon]|tara:strand:+ start:501 stop:1514 length:1014 start_codon:yes stop_codon:yes gene_type:complete
MKTEKHLESRPKKTFFSPRTIKRLKDKAAERIKEKFLPNNKIIKIVLIGGSVKNSFGKYDSPGFRGSLYSDFDFIIFVKDNYKIPKWLKKEPMGKPFPDDKLNLAYRNKKFIDKKYDIEVFFIKEKNIKNKKIQKLGEMVGIPMTKKSRHKNWIIYEKDVKIEIVKNKNLTKTEKDAINKARVDDWGEKNRRDFKKHYEPDTLWFFVKKGKKIVSIGGLRPIKIKYLGKTYNIKGICSTISVVRMKGYGRVMVAFIINYSRKTGKTLLGFTGKTEFFKKVGLGTKKDFIKRFVYVNPKTKEKIYDSDGDGIYYDGKDKLISKILKTKSPVYIGVEHW